MGCALLSRQPFDRESGAAACGAEEAIEIVEHNVRCGVGANAVIPIRDTNCEGEPSNTHISM